MHVESRHGLDELRCLARREREARMRVRIQAIVLAVQSRPSTEIAQTLDVGTRSVQEWVRRYNQGGVDALRRRSGQGRPCWLSKEQRAHLCDRVDIGAYEFGIGDYDCDQTVNLSDFAAWQGCMTGPSPANTAVPQGCEPFDFNTDSAVDLRDYYLLSHVFTAP